MKRLLFLFAPLVIGLFIFVSSASASSYVYSYSTVGYDSGTNTVTGYSYTSYPYGGSLYYQPYVEATLYDENGTYLADGDFSQTQGGPATITLQAPGSGCQFYQIVGWHAVDDFYYVTNYYMPSVGYRNGFYDVDYYSQFRENPTYPPFGESRYFYGAGPVHILEEEFISLGVTESWGSGNCNLPPTITSISPALGGVGSATSITITGTGFKSGSIEASINSMSNITISEFFVDSGTQMRAKFTIAANAGGGNRTVAVTLGGIPSDNNKNFFVQIPTSLTVVSVTKLSGTTNPTTAGCWDGDAPGDYGLRVSVRYQVMDQQSTAVAITNNKMVLQEALTDSVINGETQADKPLADMGPSRITGTTRTTNSSGQYLDSPVGVCNSSSVTATLKQTIKVLIDTTSTIYSVRVNSFTMTGPAFQTGSISNGSDIVSSRP